MENLFYWLCTAVMLAGTLFSVKVPGGKYVGELVMGDVFATLPAKIVVVILVLATILVANRYMRVRNKRLFLVYNTLFSVMVVLSLASSIVFK